MLLLAAITSAPAPGSAIERLSAVPADFWLRLGFAVVALVLLVVFLRKVAKMNKVVLAMVTLILVSVVGFNWIYERNEPEWARPVVGFLAGFFPSKGLPAKTAAMPPAKMRP